MRVILVLSFLWTAGSLGAQSTDWELFFQRAWSLSSPAQAVDWNRSQARAAWSLEQARWLPTLSLESPDASRPQQLTGGGSGSSGWASTSVALVLTLKPAGGGTVRAGVQGASDSFEPLKPQYSIEAVLPLARQPTRDLARLAYEAEVLQCDRAALAGWQDLVRAASKLDLARWTAESEASLCAGALHRVERLRELRAQGRETEAALVAAEGAWIRTVREWQEAQAALDSALLAWARISPLPLPPVEPGPLRAWALTRAKGPRLADLDAQLQGIRSEQEDLRIVAERAALAPLIGLKFISARPGDVGWAWTGQVGLSLTTDLLVLGPWLETGRETSRLRWSRLIADAVQEADDRSSLTDRLLERLPGLAAALERQSRNTREVRDALASEARQRGVPLAEVLALDAEVAALALEERRLVWDEILGRVTR